MGIGKLAVITLAGLMAVMAFTGGVRAYLIYKKEKNDFYKK